MTTHRYTGFLRVQIEQAKRQAAQAQRNVRDLARAVNAESARRRYWLRLARLLARDCRKAARKERPNA